MPNALQLVTSAFVAVIKPPEQFKPSAWASQNLIVPDGQLAGQKWDIGLTPYIIEPLDALAPEVLVNKVVVRKSAQTGFTTLGIAFVAHSIACDPCRMMIVQPTDSALTDFVRDKLNPALDSPSIAKFVKPQSSRSSQGSTNYTKNFQGGSLNLVIASSAPDLRSKTIKKVFKDEVSEYPNDLDGQGSPHAMIEARYMSFLNEGSWKELNVSTPTIKGECYIDEQFEKGDKRYWFVPCPGCGEPIRFQFNNNFIFNESPPHNAHFVAECCGTIIDSDDKNHLIKQGKWIATKKERAFHRSYHFDALSSPFVPWNIIAERYLRAKDDPSSLKAFYNLILGLPYEVTGEAPAFEELQKRASSEWKRKHIPPQALMLIGAADIQDKGIYYEILAFAPDRQSWVIDADYISGSTEDADQGAFAVLGEVFERTYPDDYGNHWGVDAFAVDSGFRTNVVYSWTRQRPHAYAVKGADGWGRPPLSAATPVDITIKGKKNNKGAKVHLVGTWSLKASFYADLNKQMGGGGEPIFPAGYCHFGTWLDEGYYKQLTSEFLAVEVQKNKRQKKTWKVRARHDNHWLDTRVYNCALADYLGLRTMTQAAWEQLARNRNNPLPKPRDLFENMPQKAQQTTEAPKVEVVTRVEPQGLSMAALSARLQKKKR